MLAFDWAVSAIPLCQTAAVTHAAATPPLNLHSAIALGLVAIVAGAINSVAGGGTFLTLSFAASRNFGPIRRIRWRFGVAPWRVWVLIGIIWAASGGL